MLMIGLLKSGSDFLCHLRFHPSPTLIPFSHYLAYFHTPKFDFLKCHVLPTTIEIGSNVSEGK